MTASVFLLTGTPGAGKSTVALSLMQRFDFGLHLPVDDLREWVVSGMAHPVPEWTTETGRQFRLARGAAGEVALLYAEQGFAVAIDDVVDAEEADQFFPQPIKAMLHKILLRPTLAVALARNAARTSKAFDTAVLAPVIERLHRQQVVAEYEAAGWHVLDNSSMSTAETVDAILLLRSQPLVSHNFHVGPCAACS